MEGTDVPGTYAFLARLVPDRKGRLSIDVALISLGDVIGEDLEIKANNRFTFGLGYRF